MRQAGFSHGMTQSVIELLTQVTRSRVELGGCFTRDCSIVMLATRSSVGSLCCRLSPRKQRTGCQ